MNAALYASTEIMELLLKNGANARAINKDGETALMWAVHDLEKIKLLIKHGAEVNAKANTGNTPLLIACVGNDRKETINFLLQNGADPLIKNNREETAFMRSALFGDSASLALLLKKGMDINAKDKEGFTALINALFNVNREATFFLLNNGADPDMVVAFGLTAVTAVVTYNDLPSVKAVLNKAKNINTVDDLGNSVLMWAVYNEHDNTDIIKVLLDKGANPKIVAKYGETALSWAKKKGNTKTVALLKNAGAQ
jgi:ankyrin repeat protein